MSPKIKCQKVLDAVDRIHHKSTKGFLDETTCNGWLQELEEALGRIEEADLWKHFNRIKAIFQEGLVDGPITVDEFQRPLIRIEHYCRLKIYGPQDERVIEISEIISRKHELKQNEFVEAVM